MKKKKRKKEERKKEIKPSELNEVTRSKLGGHEVH